MTRRDDRRRAAALLALTVAASTGLVLPAAAAGFKATPSATMSVSSASLGAPQSVHCTATTGAFSPVTFAWSIPTALTGKSTSPLSYTVRRKIGAGSYSVLATGVTATSYSDDPHLLASLGTVFSYTVEADYGNWVGTVSSAVTATYTSVLAVTVLSTCSP